MAAAKIVAADPNVDGFMSAIGAGGSSASFNNGRMFMRLKDRSERKLSANQIIQELRPKLAQIPGINVYMQNPPLIRVGGMLTKALYQFSLQDTDTKELFHWAPMLMDKIAEQKHIFQDVTSDLQIASPQVNVEIDRDKAAALGVTRAANRERALRRLRRTPDLHDLRRRGRILGRLRGAAAIPARPRRARRSFTSPVP